MSDSRRRVPARSDMSAFGQRASCQAPPLVVALSHQLAKYGLPRSATYHHSTHSKARHCSRCTTLLVEQHRMKLTIFNGTDKHLSFSQWSGSSSKSLSDTSMLLGESDLVVPPHASAATTVSKKSFTLGIKPIDTDEAKAASPDVAGGLQAAYKLPLKLGAKWKSIHASSDFPWRVYRSKVYPGGRYTPPEDNPDLSHHCL